MEQALPLANAGALETRNVLRNGDLFAVLRTVDHGGSFTVVVELVGDPAGDAARIRPYTFAHREEASAFLTEVASSFAYLGCEIDRA